MKKAPYQIFFFGPGESQYRIAEFDSPVAPPTYNVGDVINAQYWDADEWKAHGGPFFRVRCVEHKVAPASDNKHVAGTFQIGIYLDKLSTKEMEKLIGTQF